MLCSQGQHAIDEVNELPEGVRRINLDLDGRARELLQQLDLARACSKKYMDTDVLLAMEQRYVTHVLTTELEKEVDKVLLTQVFERENLDRALEEEATFARNAIAATTAEADRLRGVLEKEQLMKQVMQHCRDRASLLPGRCRQCLVWVVFLSWSWSWS